jgi:hypothetical protein
MSRYGLFVLGIISAFRRNGWKNQTATDSTLIPVSETTSLCFEFWGKNWLGVSIIQVSESVKPEKVKRPKLSSRGIRTGFPLRNSPDTKDIFINYSLASRALVSTAIRIITNRIRTRKGPDSLQEKSQIWEGWHFSAPAVWSAILWHDKRSPWPRLVSWYLIVHCSATPFGIIQIWFCAHIIQIMPWTQSHIRAALLARWGPGRRVTGVSWWIYSQ